MSKQNELLENAIKSKSFIRKDILGGNYVDFPSTHGKLVAYAIDNNIKYNQNKFFKDNKTSFVTELIFDSEEQARYFYENMDEILDLEPFFLR